MSSSSAGTSKPDGKSFRFGWLFVCFLVLAVGISGCDVLAYPLGGAQFAQRGRELADDSSPGLGVVEVRVDSVFVELMSYQAMELRLGDWTVGIDPNKPVWVATVRGRFVFDSGFGGNPILASQRIFVFDATSGELMRSQTREK